MLRLINGIKSACRNCYNVALIEVILAIFIVGFVILSIVAGSTLMEQAKLRSLISEVGDLNSRIASFEMMYDFKPGDMPNASDFWGVGSCGGTVYGANGDGDGLIGYKKLQIEPNKHDAIIESYSAWCHMAMANMGPSVSVLVDLDVAPLINVNLPRAKIGGAFHLTSGKLNTFGMDDDINAIVVGVPTKDMSIPKAVLTPKQARSVDLKMDNGDPNSGKVRAATGTDAGEDCIVDGVYSKSDDKLCVMAFALTKPETNVK